MQPLPPVERLIRPVRQGGGRRRVLWWMLAGSVLLHLLGLLAVFWARPEPMDQENASLTDEVAMVFEGSGAKEASVPTPSATQASASPLGNVTATTVQPDPDTSAPSPPPAQPPPAPSLAPPPSAPPTPPVQASEAQVPPPPVPLPTLAQPVPQPAPELAQSAELPQPIPRQAAPRSPPTVTLSQEDEPLPTPPPFVMPQPPPPLPPLQPPPRLAQPRSAQPFVPQPQYARPSPRNPFGNPQEFSLDAAPSPRAPGRPSRGFDLSPGPRGGQSESETSYVSGARPTGDWFGAFRRWAQARIYYPEQAAIDGQDGVAVVLLEVARSGKVLSVRLVQSARSPFLDGAWVDIFRNATLPPITSDVPGETTTFRARITYRLIRR